MITLDTAREIPDDDTAQEESFIKTATSSLISLSKFESGSFKALCPQILASVIAASFNIVVGVGLSFSAILLPQLNETTSDIHISTDEGAWIASVIVLVVPIGSIVGGFVMDSYGRLNCLKLSAIPNTIGYVIMATAQSVPMLIAGRIFIGFAVSWCCSPAVVYTAEIANKNIRGSLSSLGPVYASLGMVLLFLKGWFLHWRTVAWLGLVYSIFPAVLVHLFIPESPAWLVSKGRSDEAAKSLRWINKYQSQTPNGKESLPEMQLFLLQKEHQTKLQREVAQDASGFMLGLRQFASPVGRKPMTILIFLFFFQMFSGIYATLFYSVLFFKAIGTIVNPYLASSIIGTVRLLMSFVNTFLLRRFGRRPLIMISGFGMALCMASSGMFTKWLIEGTFTQTWVPMFIVVMYVITSMIGLLPIPWTMTAELFPLEIRGLAHSIAYSIANVLMFASVQSYFMLNNWFGGIVGIQWFYGTISLLTSLFIWLFLPETHGKKLSEITEYFSESGWIYPLKNKRKLTKPGKPNATFSGVSGDIIKLNIHADAESNSYLPNKCGK